MLLTLTRTGGRNRGARGIVVHVCAEQHGRLEAHLQHHLRVSLGCQVQRVDDDCLRTKCNAMINVTHVLLLLGRRCFTASEPRPKVAYCCSILLFEGAASIVILFVAAIDATL